jgi:lipopolysaccharide transport system permease protein
MTTASVTDTSRICRPLREGSIRVQPSRGRAQLRIGEVWKFRELLGFLIWRDVKVRYKQTALGAAWAILQPVFTMLAFSLFLGRLAKVPSDHVPYPIFAFAGLLPWTFFVNGLTASASSIVISANMVQKVYFPRLTIPIAAVAAGTVDLALAFSVLIVLMIWYGIAPNVHMFLLPFFFLIALATSLGAGLWLSAMNVKFRDVRYALPFLAQFWFYGTPIAYPSSLLHEPWRTIYAMNPMVAVVEGFRWCLLGTTTLSKGMTAVSAGMALIFLVTGAYYFRSMERKFADIV